MLAWPDDADSRMPNRQDTADSPIEQAQGATSCRSLCRVSRAEYVG